MASRIFFFIVGLIITGCFVWTYIFWGWSWMWIAWSVAGDIYSLVHLVAAAAKGES